jgi:8-oxo-dGTP pyrophosphatase MutT (NUDIX family)
MNLVAVAIISRQNSQGQDEFLLVSSKRDFGEFTGCYYPPGGHIEDAEDEAGGLKRELIEELGVEIEVGEKIAETAGDVADQITSWWKCKILSGEFRPQDNEIANAGFFTREQMRNLKLWPATKKFFEL